MTVAAATWNAYAQLLNRLSPQPVRVVFADADAAPLWASDPAAVRDLEPTLLALLASASGRTPPVDGLAAIDAERGAHYGFRVRGALGELLGLVGIARPPAAGPHPDLGLLHAALKPALDCLQSEMSARASLGDLHAHLRADQGGDFGLFSRLAAAGAAEDLGALGRIPELANEYLDTAVAAIMLPDRHWTICRARAGAPNAGEGALLAQLHRHLMTRAQLHGCTLVANRLQLPGSDAAVPYKALSAPIRDAARRVVGVLAAFRLDTDPDFEAREADAIELLARKAAQIIASSFDALTGMLTRPAFLAQAADRLAHAAPRVAHGLVYVDVDQLGVVNENHGMHVGDEVIRAVAELVKRAARADGLVARVGPDRFALLVAGCGVESAARIAEDLRGAAVRLSGARGDKPLMVSVSVGVARAGDRPDALGEAMAAAELACRSAKERGRNRVEVFYGAGPTCDPVAVSPLVAELSAALAADAFELVAQPILPLTAAPAEPRFEVLLRMRAGDGSRVSIDKLNGVAGSELARAIDRWVVNQALNRLAACRDRLRDHPARFALNLSGAALGDADFWRFLEERVRAARLEPGTLSFEIPHEATAGLDGLLAPAMLRLRELGVSFALDHVGRHPEAIARLNALPVSCVKIDGCVSRTLAAEPQSRSLVLALAQLAQTFGLETVAAHVETDEIRAAAAGLGVQFGQGFFIGKPLDLDDVIRDLPFYSCFATSTGIYDRAFGVPAQLN